MTAVREPILRRLVRRYLELESQVLSPPPSQPRRERTGARPRRHGGPPEAWLVKVDLDEALEEVYARFFGD